MNGIDGKRILITGGTGSLGQPLARRLLSEYSPRSVTIFSRDEFKQAAMKANFSDSRLDFIPGDVRDYVSVASVVSNADIVINTAAMKRVEVCESHPDEAVATNYHGAANIVRAIRELHLPVQVVVNIGSDKGAHPMNVYGASKFLQECRFLSANYECPNTRFVGVRYGNVMGSRGSVLPIWQEQIKNGQPLTVTDPLMTRFLISLDQAVDTILQAIEYARPGEVYIPRLPAAKIGDMATVMANSHHDTKIVGKGQGEKDHEVLITQEESHFVTADNAYFVITKHRQVHPVMVDEYISSDHVIPLKEIYTLFAKQGWIAQAVAA